jgi:hypothetical protein
MAIDHNSSFDDLQFAIDDESALSDGEVSSSDSGILMTQAVDPDLLTISRNGDTTTIGFQSDHMHDDVCLAAYRERVLQLVDDPSYKKFQFDLSNIKILPSGMLGLMASLRKRGYAVDLLNPSHDVLEVLQVMKMDSVFGIQETPQ